MLGLRAGRGWRQGAGKAGEAVPSSLLGSPAPRSGSCIPSPAMSISELRRRRASGLRGGPRRALWIALALACGLGLAGLAACRTGGLLTAFQASPHERYAESLRTADLAGTELGRAWIRESTLALAEAPRVELPYREIGYFDPARPEASAFEVALPAGQRLEVAVRTEPAEGTWFLDLLRRDGEEWAPVASAEEALAISRRLDEPDVLVVRLQPELLRGGRYEILLQGLGSLAFPVEGAGPRNIGGRFGDPRNGGRRSHRGVDIFAPRGTPALAAADGWVTRVGTNPLGGNVVHVRGDGLSFYYAHLDRQAVRTGARVGAGEILGEVGNTGNARSTPPHLHFGLFRGGEAVDPYTYLVDLGAGSPPVEAPVERVGEWARTTARRLRLRGGPDTSFPVLDELPEQYALRVQAAVRDFYRVRTPAGATGFVAARFTAGTGDPIAHRAVDRTVEVLAEPAAGSPPVAVIARGETVAVRARAGELLLVTSSRGASGWIPAL